jgi:hypothetical protein
MKIRGIRAAIVVYPRSRTRADTVVAIDHRIPDTDAESAEAVWRISTGSARLLTTEFRNAAAINRRFTEGRGRAIACIEIASGTTMAAVAYHLDDGEDLPILLTDVAIRTNPAWVEISRGCVLILKAYLHELGSKLGRPDGVGVFAGSRSEAQEYSRLSQFRPAAVPDAWRQSGRWYLEQQPCDD